MKGIHLAFAFVSRVLTAVGNNLSAPTPCVGCVSNSWHCTRDCNTNQAIGLSYVFDGSYKHDLHTCHEFIPYDGNTVQADADLYCIYPEAQWCRDMLCTKPFIGCDNMHMITLVGLSRLSQCQSKGPANNLMTEDCGWVCKHRRPFLRCKVHFDHLNSYGLAGNLQTCWIQESCAANQETLVETTCQPEIDSGVVMELAGSLTMSVADASAVLTSSAAASALQDAIASSLVAVRANMVKILSIDGMVRRLAMLPSTLLANRRLQEFLSIHYTITVPESDSGAVSSALIGANTTAMALQIESAFANAGISAGTVQVSNISQPTASIKDSAELRQSRAELAALQSLIAIVDAHLQEAMEELNATIQTLGNSSLTQNLTQEELDALKAKHAAAKSRLEDLAGSNNELQDRLANASVWHNVTVSQLLEAHANIALTKSKYEQALSDLSASQVSLAVAEAKSNATFDQLSEALAAHNLTLSQLANLNSSHSAVVAQLEALNNNYTNAVQELAEITAVHNAFSESLSEAEQANHVASQKFDDAQKANTLSSEGLQAAVSQETALDSDLTQVTASLTSVREEMWSLTKDYNATSSALLNTRLSLADAIKELKRLQKQWELDKALEKEKLLNASKKLEQERADHDKTKQSLQESLQNEEESESSRTLLLILSGGLALVVVIFSVTFCALYRFRKPLAFWCLRCHICHTDSTSNGDSVVVGRPVGTSGVVTGAPPGKTSDETAKGVPASMPPSDNIGGLGEIDVDVGETPQTALQRESHKLDVDPDGNLPTKIVM